ncbi:Integrase core domain-containing protein [Kosakonia oryzae]|uniref:Integrase core domain-containing protein n=1 Tax=Kosakonia oryzae TaxID=497725 RepID=A0AA94H4A3_9ENTR|nr:Integrase core domain-containing protein [Kosakonia oryzae]
MEILACHLFRTLSEVREITDRWLLSYNSEWSHESLNNLTAEEYGLMAQGPEISKNVCFHYSTLINVLTRMASSTPSGWINLKSFV